MARSTPITIAGREFQLRYEINCIADMEEQTGRSLQQLLGGGLTLAGLRAILWAGLKWRRRDLSRNDVGTLLQEHMTSPGGDPTGEDLSGPILEALRAGGIVPPEGDEEDVEGKAGAAPDQENASAGVTS